MRVDCSIKCSRYRVTIVWKEWGATSRIHKCLTSGQRILLYIYSYYDWYELSVILTLYQNTATTGSPGHCAINASLTLYQNLTRQPVPVWLFWRDAGIKNKMFEIGAQGSDRRPTEASRYLPVDPKTILNTTSSHDTFLPISWLTKLPSTTAIK